MFLLSEIKPPNCIELSLYANVFSATQPCLVISRVNCLQFYAVHVSGIPSFQLLDSVNVEDKIIAMNKFQHPQLSADCLLLLTESSKVLFVHYDESISKLSVVFNVTLDSFQQQTPLDSPPRIVVDTADPPEFFLVYCFENFIQLFTINAAWSKHPVTSTKRQKKQVPNNLVTAVAFSVGNVVLQDMQLLHSKHSILALLYRDYNYNYSLRYYEIDPQKKTFNLMKQFEEFQDVPNALIAPNTGGSLILTNGFVFYFPDPEVRTLDIPDSNESLSINRENMVITKRLNNTPNDLSVFHRSVVIDNKRILVVNNKGHSSILYINGSKKSDHSFELEDLGFINLGFTTTPNSVHHITENLFFVSSKLSQSVLFKILPQEPYISICQFFPSSPPILDIQASHNYNSTELLVCQGGYESGEFRRVSKRTKYLSYVAQIQSAFACTELSYIGNINGEVLVSASDTSSAQYRQYKIRNDEVTENPVEHGNPIAELITDTSTVIVRDNGITLNNDTIFSGQVLLTKVRTAKFFLAVGENNTLLAFFNEQYIQRDLKSRAEVSSLDYTYYYGGAYLTLVTFWDGTLELYLCESSEIELIYEEKLQPSGISIYSGCLSYDPGDKSSIWVYLANSNSELVEFFFDVESKTKDPHRNSTTKFKGLPLRFTRSISGQIVLFNDQQIFGLTNDEATNFNSVYPLDAEASFDIQDVILVDNRHLLVSSKNDLVLFNIEEMNTTKDVIFSNDFNLKSVPVPDCKYSILVSSKSAFNEAENDYSRAWFLQLVDTRRMRIVARHDFGDSVQIADLCFLDLDSSSNEKAFLTISNTNNPEQVIQIFKIKKNNIISLPQIKVVGLTSGSSVVYKSIVKLAGETNTFLINGALSFILRVNSFSEAEIFKAAFFRPPVFAAVGQSLDDNMVIADVMKGISIFRWKKDDDEIYQFDLASVKTVLDSNLVTDLSVYKTKFKSHLVAVDSLGNITGLSLGEATSSVEEFLRFNIGQGINCIHRIEGHPPPHDLVSKYDSAVDQQRSLGASFVLGTLNGGIYALCELLDPEYDIEDVVLGCQKELVAYKRSLSDLESTTKKDKLALWKSINDKKTLRRDDEGKPLLVDNMGVVSMELFQKWLFRDAMISSYDQRGEHTQRELAEMKAALRKCYKNKPLLQRLVHELTSL